MDPDVDPSDRTSCGTIMDLAFWWKPVVIPWGYSRQILLDPNCGSWWTLRWIQAVDPGGSCYSSGNESIKSSSFFGSGHLRFSFRFYHIFQSSHQIVYMFWVRSSYFFSAKSSFCFILDYLNLLVKSFFRFLVMMTYFLEKVNILNVMNMATDCPHWRIHIFLIWMFG